MATKAILSVNDSDYHTIDERLKPYLSGWRVEQIYRNQNVTIPGTWNSEIFPYRYFEVIKEPGEPNYKEDESENEIVLCLWAGWRGEHNGKKVAYDDEVDIRLHIREKDVLNRQSKKVSAEIMKTGGADMTLYFNDKKITEFTETKQTIVWGWIPQMITSKIDKVWIEDMNNI